MQGGSIICLYKSVFKRNSDSIPDIDLNRLVLGQLISVFFKHSAATKISLSLYIIHLNFFSVFYKRLHKRKWFG